MPIKPENRERYPANWKAIRAQILERARDRCEGSPAYPRCRAPNGSFRVKRTGQILTPMHFVSSAFDDDEVTRIVLTIGHLDHTPENCDPANLRAWCQRCHLTYDAKHHAQTVYQTRRSGRAISELFDDGEMQE